MPLSSTSSVSLTNTPHRPTRYRNRVPNSLIEMGIIANPSLICFIKHQSKPQTPDRSNTFKPFDQNCGSSAVSFRVARFARAPAALSPPRRSCGDCGPSERGRLGVPPDFIRTVGGQMWGLQVGPFLHRLDKWKHSGNMNRQQRRGNQSENLFCQISTCGSVPIL